MNWSKLKPSTTQAIIYLTVIYLIGITGMLTKGTVPIFMFLVPVNIMLVAFVAAIYHLGFSVKFVVLCTTIYIGGFVIEWLGVKTGVIFGEYSYGEGLGLKIDGVPVIMGLNWLLLVYGSLAVSGRYFQNKGVAICVASVLMLLYDFFLEPSAIRYEFWIWADNVVPVQNYLAWFLGGIVFTSLFMWVNKTAPKNKVAEGIFWLQMGFFACLLIGKNLGLGLPF